VSPAGRLGFPSLAKTNVIALDYDSMADLDGVRTGKPGRPEGKMKAGFISLAAMMLCLNGYGQQRFADENVERGLTWMFEKGVPGYFAGASRKEIRDALEKETGVMLYDNGAIYVNEPFSLLGFRLLGMGKSMYRDGGTNIFCHVHCFVRDVQNDVAEYWVIKKFDYDHVSNRCIFIVTAADTLESPRKAKSICRSLRFQDELSGFPKTICIFLFLLMPGGGR
jgi:hypothetical protein